MEVSQSQTMTWAKRMMPVLLGGLGGYAYYYFIGCVSGACPITSNPWSSTAYGAVVGLILIPRSKPRRESDGKE